MCVRIYWGVCANSSPSSYTCTYFKRRHHQIIKYESSFMTGAQINTHRKKKKMSSEGYTLIKLVPHYAVCGFLRPLAVLRHKPTYWCCCHQWAAVFGPVEAGHTLSITATRTTPARPSVTPPVNLPLTFSSSLPLLAVAMGCRWAMEGVWRLAQRGRGWMEGHEWDKGMGQWREIGMKESEEGQKKRLRMREMRRREKIGGERLKKGDGGCFSFYCCFLRK